MTVWVKKPAPQKGGSGVPSQKNINLSFDLGLGYMSFDVACETIDKIIEKYGDRTLFISASIDTKEQQNV